MNTSATCLLCSHRVSRHICAGNLYWFCSHCRQSVPTHEITREPYSFQREGVSLRHPWRFLIDLHPETKRPPNWNAHHAPCIPRSLSSPSQRG